MNTINSIIDTESDKGKNEKSIAFSEVIDSKGFYKLENNMIRFYGDLGITEPQFLFLNVLYAAGTGGEIRPKQTTIAGYLGVSDRWIRNIGKELSDKTYIKRWRKTVKSSYRYNLDPVEKILSFHARKDSTRARAGHFLIPKAFLNNFGYFRDKYKLNPTHFVLMCLMLMYRNAPSFDSLTYKMIEQFLGWSPKSVQRAVNHLHEHGFITAYRATRGVNYSFDVIPFISLLEREIIELERLEVPANSSGQKAAKVTPFIQGVRSNSSGQVRSNSSGQVRSNSSGQVRSNSSGLKKEKREKENINNKKGNKEKENPLLLMMRVEIEESDLLPMQIRKVLSMNMESYLTMNWDYKQIAKIVKRFTDKEGYNIHTIKNVLKSIVESNTPPSEFHSYFVGALKQSKNNIIERDQPFKYKEQTKKTEPPLQLDEEKIKERAGFIKMILDKQQNKDVFIDTLKKNPEHVAAFNWLIKNNSIQIEGRYKNGITFTT